MITNFHNKKMPKEKAPCKCLSIIMIDSVVRANKKYYPQTFLEKCKYIPEKIKTEKHTDDDVEKSELDSSFNDETESDIDNGEYDESFVECILIVNKSLIVCIDHALLGFYFCQSV